MLRGVHQVGVMRHGGQCSLATIMGRLLSGILSQVTRAMWVQLGILVDPIQLCVVQTRIKIGTDNMAMRPSQS